jgi:cytochrome P450
LKFIQHLLQDTTILFSFYSINTSTEYWKDPEIFMPERFLDENGLLLPHEKVIPFGLGKQFWIILKCYADFCTMVLEKRL